MINLLKCVVHKSFSKEKLTWEGFCYNIVKKPKLFFSSTKKSLKPSPQANFPSRARKLRKKKFGQISSKSAPFYHTFNYQAHNNYSHTNAHLSLCRQLQGN